MIHDRMHDINAMERPTAVILHKAEAFELHASPEACRNPEIHNPWPIYLIHQASHEDELQKYLKSHEWLEIHPLVNFVEISLKMTEARNDTSCDPPGGAYDIQTIADAYVEDHVDKKISADVMPVPVQ